MKHNILKSILLGSALSVLLLNSTSVSAPATCEPVASGQASIDGAAPANGDIIPLSDEDDVETYLV